MRIKQLFARLTAIYGYVWQNQYKQSDCILLAAKEWGETLRSIDDESLEKAIQHCKKQCALPPTLPGFYQICRNYQSGSTLKLIPKIETRVATPEVAQANIRKLREILSQQTATLKGVQ